MGFDCTVSPLYNSIRYKSKLRYNVSSVCTKISGSCNFSLVFQCYSLGKHTFVYLLESYDSLKNSSKVSIIHALDGSISSFFITANSI